MFSIEYPIRWFEKSMGLVERFGAFVAAVRERHEAAHGREIETA